MNYCNVSSSNFVFVHVNWFIQLSCVMFFDLESLLTKGGNSVDRMRPSIDFPSRSGFKTGHTCILFSEAVYEHQSYLARILACSINPFGIPG